MDFVFFGDVKELLLVEDEFNGFFYVFIVMMDVDIDVERRYLK